VDKGEAKEILAAHLARYRGLTYAELVRRLKTVDTEEITGPSGTVYQLEVQFFWDNRPNGNVRVIGAIDDGGISWLVPLSGDFIMAPDGSFVDE
jgi:hypothetical protein